MQEVTLALGFTDLVPSGVLSCKVAPSYVYDVTIIYISFKRKVPVLCDFPFLLSKRVS